jgi:type II secretory ATPase GspE/PulE/Tfp pilus assembly ATPase PilB-like protein
MTYKSVLGLVQQILDKLYCMKLGTILIDKGLLRSDQLETALREQSRSHRFLGDILLTLGFIKESDLYTVLAEQLNRPVLYEFKPSYHLHPGGWVEIETSASLNLATSDPDNLFLHQKWRQVYGRDPDQIYLMSPKQMAELAQPNSSSRETIPDLFRSIVEQALIYQASDIHFVPGVQHCQIHLRIDGVLVPFQTIHKDQWLSLCSHIKVLGQLDLAENRRPQDGAFRLDYLSDPIDCRLSIMPTKDGESLVIRLLDPRSILKGLDHLGLLPHQVKTLEEIARLPSGLFIITGPTGSGKTTTLYAMLSAMAGQGRNVMTVEQPVEYRLEHIRQTEIHPDVTSFGDALRSILRHDPDVIYVSEIRDSETALTAVRAAMTGHLVLTTLHTTDVNLITNRLEDLGVPSAYLKDVLVGCMAQRLVRRKCCDAGCDQCFNTGYKGRQVIAEIVTLTKRQETIQDVANTLEATGITTRSELDRVLGRVGVRVA